MQHLQVLLQLQEESAAGVVSGEAEAIQAGQFPKTPQVKRKIEMAGGIEEKTAARVMHAGETELMPWLQVEQMAGTP